MNGVSVELRGIDWKSEGMLSEGVHFQQVEKIVIPSGESSKSAPSLVHVQVMRMGRGMENGLMQAIVWNVFMQR